MQNALRECGFVSKKLEDKMRPESTPSNAANNTAPLRGADDWRLAIVVSPDQPIGFLANTVATIAVGLGAAHPGLGNVRLRDREDKAILSSADRPVPILQADSAQMFAILEKAQTKGQELKLVVFPEFARKLHSFDEYEVEFPNRSLRNEPLSGLGLCGCARSVKSLTGSLKLLR